MTRIDRLDYEQLVRRVVQVANEVIPAGGVVLVASKGDDELLRLRGRAGCHFPQNDEGIYVGHHPLDSRAAMNHLEAARAKGAEYLVIPATALWWLDYYKQFAALLRERYEVLHSDESCVIYRLAMPSGTSKGQGRVKGAGRAIRRTQATGNHRTDPDGTRLATLQFHSEPARHLRFALDYAETYPLSPPPRPFNPRRMSLHWLVPDFSPGMGGHAVIFRLMGLLEQFGHKNTLWIRGGTRHGSAEKARQVLREHFTPLKAMVRLFDDPNELRGDAVLATHCWTAYPARAVTRVRQRFYFVQDFEPLFYPMGSEYLLAEATYSFGFPCIVSSKWLQDLLRSRYSARAERFVYAYDPDVYFEDSQVARAENRIAFYARSSTPRRAAELGLLALEQLAKRGRRFAVDFFGGDMGKIKVPYEYCDHGVLSAPQLAQLYRSSTIGMAFSSTNYSLVPHEMMACGLPVVDLSTGGNSGEFPLDTITLSEPTPGAIGAHVERLLDDPALRERQAAQARQYVRQLSWERSARKIERALADGIEMRDGPRSTAVTKSRAALLSVAHRPEGINALEHSREASRFRGPVVFVGQPEYYRSVYYDLTSVGAHFEFPYTSAAPALLRKLPSLCAHHGARTCIVFRPEWLASYPETFWKLKSLGIAVIGWSTEPVPQCWARAHADQLRRLESLRAAARLPYDLLIHFDPSSLDFLAELGFAPLIAHPLPVSRRLFFPEEVATEFDVCFLGRSTPHREAMLAPLKMRFNILHVAHGLRDENARVVMNRSKLVLNLHNDAYPNFENRVVQALACRRPVLSERLSGDLLIANRDYVLVDSPDDLLREVSEWSNRSIVPAPQVDLSPFWIEKLLERLGIDAI